MVGNVQSSSNQNFVKQEISRKRNLEGDKSLFLKEKLEDVQDKQGIIGKCWNGIKEITTLGVSHSDCEDMLEKYNKGEVSFEDAVQYIEQYDTKQDNMKGLLSNIITGVGAIITATVATSAGPIGWLMAFKKGAPIGALVKTTVNFIDRATNNIENDAFDLKEITRDAVSGAMTGTASAVSSGVGMGIKSKDLLLTVKNGTKCGLMCGGMSGAVGYTTDALLDEDKEFNLKDLAINAATSAFVSGSVGAIVGGGMYGGANLSGTLGQESSKTVAQTIAADSITSSARKMLGQAERNLLTA